MSCGRNKCYEQEYNGGSCEECMKDAPHDYCCKLECGEHEFCRGCQKAGFDKKIDRERGLTIGELVSKLLEIPNQEQRVVMNIYKDGIFLKDKVRGICQSNREVVIL